MLSAICFNLGQSKILSSGNGLRKARSKYLMYGSEEYFIKMHLIAITFNLNFDHTIPTYNDPEKQLILCSVNLNMVPSILDLLYARSRSFDKNH